MAKIPEFIPFHFDKFNKNLFAKHGPIGVGRWCMIRKAVAEMPTLTIDLNDISDRESLEIDSGCSTTELDDLLDYAAQRGMIDAKLYATGILWIENLDEDLGRFFTVGKRNLPQRPQLHGKIPISDRDFVENSSKSAQDQEKFHKVGSGNGIPTHETKRNETRRDETNENAHAQDFQEVDFSKQKFDAAKESREFQSVYSLKQGAPFVLERVYAQTVKMMFERLQIPYTEAAKRLKQAAGDFMTYHTRAGTGTQFIDMPETFLEKGKYETDWIEAARNLKLENTEKNGKSNASKDYTDAAREHAKRSGL